MRISIITINHNNREGLGRTLDSVFAQTRRPDEYIVIDGGSTDGGRALIESVSHRLTHWVSEPDGGIYPAMNKGVRAATGDYALFLNSGDVLSAPDVLERVAPLLESGKDFYVGSLLHAARPGGRIDAPRNPGAHFMACNTLSHQAAFIRLDLLRRRPYREDLRIMGDWEQMFYELIMRNASYERMEVTVARFDTTGISSWASSEGTREREVCLVLEEHLGRRLTEAVKGRSRTEQKMLYALDKDAPWERNFKILRNALKLCLQTLLGQDVR